MDNETKERLRKDPLWSGLVDKVDKGIISLDDHSDKVMDKETSSVDKPRVKKKQDKSKYTNIMVTKIFLGKLKSMKPVNLSYEKFLKMKLDI